MKIFIDTSALLKKYILENGTGKIDAIMNEADHVYVSIMTGPEAHSTFRRLLYEKAIVKNDYGILKKEFDTDYQYYTRVDIDDSVSENAKFLIEKYQLKTLDSVQLGTALFLKDEIDFFVVSDARLIKSGMREGLKIINPEK